MLDCEPECLICVNHSIADGTHGLLLQLCFKTLQNCSFRALTSQQKCFRLQQNHCFNHRYTAIYSSSVSGGHVGFSALIFPCLLIRQSTQQAAHYPAIEIKSLEPPKILYFPSRTHFSPLSQLSYA